MISTRNSRLQTLWRTLCNLGKGAVDWKARLQSRDQQNVRNLLQESMLRTLPDEWVTRALVRTRRYRERILLESDAGQQWKQPRVAGAWFRPTAIGLAVAAIVAILILAPESQPPLTEQRTEELNGNGAEVAFYLEEHARASAVRAFDQGNLLSTVAFFDPE